MKLNPNEAVALWISIVLGKEKYINTFWRIIFILILPMLPISWLLWWAVYIVVGESS